MNFQITNKLFNDLYDVYRKLDVDLNGISDLGGYNEEEYDEECKELRNNAEQEVEIIIATYLIDKCNISIKDNS